MTSATRTQFLSCRLLNVVKVCQDITMVHDKHDARHPDLGAEAIDKALRREPSQATALMAQLILLADARTQALEAEVDRLHAMLEAQYRQDKQQQWRRDAQVSAALKQVLKRTRRVEDQLRELRKQQQLERVSELQLLRQEIVALREEYKTGSAAEPAHEAVSAPSPSTLPAYLLSGYADITSLLAEARESEQLKKRTEVAETRFRAADRACNLLGKLCDDEEYYAQLRAATQLAGKV
jgi:DNA gyrase/topoisomerase IV subunit A